jgi:hypothetical protein
VAIRLYSLPVVESKKESTSFFRTRLHSRCLSQCVFSTKVTIRPRFSGIVPKIKLSSDLVLTDFVLDLLNKVMEFEKLGTWIGQLV